MTKDRQTDSRTPMAVEVTRGDTVESRHAAVVVVVDAEGQTIAHFGDPDYVTFTRSSLKPFQALPTVARGVTEKFHLGDRHIAIMCGSHSGEPMHELAAEEILEAIGCDVDNLQCGVHIPYHYRNTSGPVPPISEFSALFNNCSGKHSGMLALAKLLNAPIENYLDPESPVQMAIRDSVISMTGVAPDRLQLGIDGCSAPNYAMPLRNLALGFARLAAAKESSRDGQTRAAYRIVNAMRSHPELVSGTGRFDLALAQATDGTIVSKVGGEAVQGIAVPGRGWGIALKIVDGQSRALPALIADVLEQLELIDPETKSQLAQAGKLEQRNHRGLVTGRIRSLARLTF